VFDLNVEKFTTLKQRSCPVKLEINPKMFLELVELNARIVFKDH